MVGQSIPGFIMIKILVSDGNPVVRLGIKAILAEIPDMEVVDEAGSGQELLDTAGKKGYDVVIFEIDRPAGNGLDFLQELRNKIPKAAILIFTHLPEDSLAVRVLKMGAAGYLRKQSEPEELIKAILKIAQGKKYISEKQAELLASNLDLNLEKPVHEKLSDREYQVFILTVLGKKQKEIADILLLNKATIAGYQNKIYSKMMISNKSDMVRYATKNSLVGNRDDRPIPSAE
jgi:two-component system, NarL family, invasion response regulator UvrY